MATNHSGSTDSSEFYSPGSGPRSDGIMATNATQGRSTRAAQEDPPPMEDSSTLATLNRALGQYRGRAKRAATGLVDSMDEVEAAGPSVRAVETLKFLTRPEFDATLNLVDKWRDAMAKKAEFRGLEADPDEEENIRETEQTLIRCRSKGIRLLLSWDSEMAPSRSGSSSTTASASATPREGSEATETPRGGGARISARLPDL